MVNNPSNWSKIPAENMIRYSQPLVLPPRSLYYTVWLKFAMTMPQKSQITRKHITIPGTKKNILFMMCACLVRYPKVAECSRLRAVVLLFWEPCAASEKAKLCILMAKRGRVCGVSFFFRASAFVPRVFTARPSHLTRARDQLWLKRKTRDCSQSRNVADSYSYLYKSSFTMLAVSRFNNLFIIYSNCALNRPALSKLLTYF